MGVREEDGEHEGVSVGEREQVHVLDGEIVGVGVRDVDAVGELVTVNVLEGVGVLVFV